jgi:hypothetical protein
MYMWFSTACSAGCVACGSPGCSASRNILRNLCHMWLQQHTLRISNNRTIRASLRLAGAQRQGAPHLGPGREGGQAQVQRGQVGLRRQEGRLRGQVPRRRQVLPVAAPTPQQRSCLEITRGAGRQTVAAVGKRMLGVVDLLRKLKKTWRVARAAGRSRRGCRSWCRGPPPPARC